MEELNIPLSGEIPGSEIAPSGVQQTAPFIPRVASAYFEDIGRYPPGEHHLDRLFEAIELTLSEIVQRNQSDPIHYRLTREEHDIVVPQIQEFRRGMNQLGIEISNEE